MGVMEIKKMAHDSVLIMTTRRFGDNRGLFSESWNRETRRAHDVGFIFENERQLLAREAAVIVDAPTYAPRLDNKTWRRVLHDQDGVGKRLGAG